MDLRALLAASLVLVLLAQSALAFVSPYAQVAPPIATPLDEPPVERWNRTYGGQGTERAFDVVRVTDGYVLGGSTTTFTVREDGESDMWVVHVDDEGRRTWTRSVGTVGSETDRALAATPDGGVLVVGELGAGEGSRLYKFDAAGDEEWSRRFGSDQLARAAVARDDGGYVIVGDVAGEGFARPGAVAFVSADGEVRIDRLTGRRIAVETFTAVVETSDGNLLLVGESDRGEDDVDAWAVKLTPNGTVVWNRLVPQPNAELHPAAVTELTNGDVLLVGVTRRGTVDDGWLARLDGETGDVVWRRTYDRLRFSDVTPNGRGALVAGSTFESRVTRDALLLSVDAQGNVQWRQTYGGDRDDVFSALAATPTGYLLAGWSDVGDDRREEFFAVAVDRPVTVTEVDVSPRSATVGEPVTVTATLTNRADDRRRYEATLFVDREPRETRARQVAVGNETTVSFEVTFDSPGSYAVGVGEATPVTVDVVASQASTPSETTEPTPEPTGESTPAETTETASPGLGPVAAVAALTIATMLLAYRLRRSSTHRR
jgi:hypothetical protein